MHSWVIKLRQTVVGTFFSFYNRTQRTVDQQVDTGILDKYHQKDFPTYYVENEISKLLNHVNKLIFVFNSIYSVPECDTYLFET